MSASIFYGLCLLIFLWYLRKGWKAGPARMIVSICALAVGYVAAMMLGDLAVPILRPLGFPDLALLGLARAAIAVLGYLFVVAAGAILFKRTEHQEVGFVRLVYGLSGALLGLAFATVVVFALVISVRLVGTLAPPAPRTATGVPVPARDRGTWSALGDRVITVTREWKDEIETGPIGPIAKVLDPLRPQEYETARRVSQVITNPESVRRFFEAPAMREWNQDERVKALAADAELGRLAQEHDFVKLMRHPKVVAFLNDPELIARAKRTDLSAALDYAVQAPTIETVPKAP